MTHLLHTIAARLAPFFLTPGTTREAASDAAIQAINACNPKSPADCLRAARILALSLAAITAAAQAEAPDLSPTQRLAYLAKANTLSRSAAQAEAAQAEAAHAKATPAQASYPPPQQKALPEKTATPTPTLPDTALTALVDQVMNQFHPIAAPRSARANPGLRQRLLQGAPLRIPA